MEQEAPAQQHFEVSSYNSQGYPKREGAEQCQFFIKNGTCQFGTTCKYHHPEFIYPGVDFNSRGFPLRPGQPDCEYYMKTQTCKYGCTCKNNHPELQAAAAHPNMVPLQQPMGGQFAGAGKGAGKGAGAAGPPAGLNSKGYPLRPGATSCAFYLKTGTCKFGATCQFNHPEGGAATVAMNPLASQGFQAAAAEAFNSKGYPLRSGVQVCPFFAKTLECKFSSTCKFDHTEGMQYSDGTQTNSLGHPIRPGQAQCSFFIKNGCCSYGLTCKFDHPEEYTALGAATGGVAPPKPKPTEQASLFNSQGLPIRPGAQSCTFFLKTGQCSFSATCKWDHPEGAGGSQPGFQKLPGAGAPTMMRATPY